MSTQVETFESWAVVEMMGHVRTAGRVTEEERFGAKMGRCDVPGRDGGFTTFYFTAASIYRLTPCTEEAARAVAIRNQPEPVHQWELPRPEAARPAREIRPESDEYAELVEGMTEDEDLADEDEDDF